MIVMNGILDDKKEIYEHEILLLEFRVLLVLKSTV